MPVLFKLFAGLAMLVAAAGSAAQVRLVSLGHPGAATRHVVAISVLDAQADRAAQAVVLDDGHQARLAEVAAAEKAAEEAAARAAAEAAAQAEAQAQRERDQAAAAARPVAAVSGSSPSSYQASNPAPAPAPAIVIGSTQQALINADRAANGLGPLSWSPCLASIAHGQAAAMAQAGYIFHGSGVNQDLGCGLGSTQTGENVGYWGGGANDSAINNLFMASAPHRANILGPYRYVGTAWVVSSTGVGYIAVEFG